MTDSERLDQIRQRLEMEWPKTMFSGHVKPDMLFLLAEVEKLEAFLHSRLMHPDYQYTTTDGPRKAFDEDEPEGEGWERNVHRGRDGWERFDYHEEAYWMRPVGVHAEAPLEQDGEMRG